MIAIGEYTISTLNDLDYYEVTSSDSMVVIEDENFTPEAVTFTSKHRLGNGNLEAYSGRFKIETSKDGETWETKYTSSGNESFKTYELPSALEDKVPYLYRQSPDSDRAVEEIVGGTVGWNQLLQNGNFESTSGWNADKCSISASNNTLILTNTNSNGTYFGVNRAISVPAGHKVLVLGTANTSGITTGTFSKFDVVAHTASQSNYTKFSSSKLEGILNAIYGIERLRINVTGTGFGVSDYWALKNVMLTDLTTMLGSTIADYIYSLEQSTAGAGVAKLKEWGFFTEDYYEYCEPTLKSVEGLVSKKTVGFNQWDEEWEVGSIANTTGENATAGTNRIRSKNYIPCLPNTAYCLYNGSNIKTMFYFYDSDKNFIAMGSQGTAQPRIDTSPLNAHYLRFRTDDNYGTTYNHDICINLSDPTRNGQYEPYESHTYSLDSTLTLRGVPKLDSNNNLYYDGDIYPADGQGKRRYGVYVFDGTENFAMVSQTLSGVTYQYFRLYSTGFTNKIANAKPKGMQFFTTHGYRNLYGLTYWYSGVTYGDKTAWTVSSAPGLCFRDDSCQNATDFKQTIAGAILVYELETPTTFTALPYHNPQIVGDTEQFVTTGIVPVGHNTKYPANIKNIRCSLYKPNETPSATTLLDQITVPIVSGLQYQPFVQRTVFEWTLSSSSTKLDENTIWAEQKPKPTQAQPYLWERSRNDYSNGTHTYSDAHCDITISGVISDVDNVKGQITNKVWQSDITTSINSYDGTTVSNIRDRVSTTEQNLTGITTRVGAVESTTSGLSSRMTAAESSISQNADNIELKVSKNGVISSINQSSESITISADKVNIVGSTAFTSLNSQVTAIQNETNQKSELIRGTQTAGTYSWTGTSTTISQLTDGMEIRYWLPFSVAGGTVSGSYSYYDGSQITTGTNSGVGLTLTLKDGTMTEEIPVYYGSMTRLTSHYGYGNIIRMIYRENVRVNNGNSTYYTVTKGFWCDANYDTNSNYVQYSTAVTSGATNGVYQYSLIMRDTANTWVSIATTNGTGTSKSAYTGGLYYDKVLYHSSGTNYASNKTTSTVYDSIGFDLRYSTNCGTTLTNRKSVYLVGTINNTDKRFYLDTTQWYTQTVPTSADGKTYIYIGEAYSSYQVWLATENKAYQYYNGRFITLEEIKDLEAMTWINSTGQNAADIIANWATDATSSTTTINGGLIQTHTIESTHLATDAIMSNNFQASQNVNSPYSVAGSFLDLTNGNFYTPNFGLDNVNGNAYFNGEITATSGQIGDDTSNYWQIGTVVDFNGNQSAAIESNGTSYIQSGDWMISNNRIDTRHYDNQRKYTYLYEDGVYWDFGLHTPSLTSDNAYENNFIYIRNHESTIPTLEGAWNYVFRVDRNGMIYINGVSLDNKYASIDGVSGAYLPMTGGNLTGNLSVGGNLSVTGTITGLKNLSINGKTYNGTEAVNVGTIGAAYGGTGQTSLINSANALINALDTGSSTPIDNDYYISQYVNGGTTTKTYHRRPMSALWLYIKGKINADTDLYTDKFVPKTGGEFTGAVTVSDALIADEITSGNLIVNGVGRFTNGIYGDLTGNASTATVAAKVADSGNGQATTFAYSKSSLSTTAYFAAWNGYELRAINPSNTLATIGAVNKTGDTMTGSLTVPTLKVNSIVNEGYVHRIDFGRPNVNQMDFYEYGGVFNFYRNTSQTSIENAILLGKITTNGWEGNVVGNVTGNASSASQLSTAGTIQTNLASTSAITYTSGGNITTGVTGTLPIANGGTGATTAQDALWNLARSADPSDLNTAKRLGIFKISNTTTNVPVKNNWGVALNITDDRAEGNTAGGSTWQFVMDTASTDVWLRRITNKNAWTSWTRFYSTSNKPTKSDVGLGNVTNNAQVKGLSSGTTSGHLVTWGSDGYTVADSGIAKGSVTTKITLSGTDYSASSNTITITKANLQSAVQDTSLVLMTAAERSKLSSIQVSEGGTIDFSGVTASAPITATVNETTKAVNITHNTSGVTQGTYRSVTVNTYGHVTAGTNPTTLSGYGITDAKIASGVITLGSNTITPLTASSTLDATKLSGTASVNTTGNATTATKFSSNRSIALTGDVTGSASSNGENGWSIATTVGDDSHNHTIQTIVPIETKTYTDITVEENNDPKGWLYFGSIHPTSYTAQWRIKYVVEASIDGVAEGYSKSIVEVTGTKSVYVAYSTYNTFTNTNYRPICGHPFYWATEAGIGGGYGHVFGLRLHSGYDPVNYPRTIKIELLEAENCTVNYMDTPVVYASVPGTGSTNYRARDSFDGTTNGITISGDRNTHNDIYYSNYYRTSGTNGVYGYSLIMKDASGDYQSIITSYGTGTTKSVNTAGFRFDGEILYHSPSSSRTSGTVFVDASYPVYGYIDFRYSSNCGTTLTTQKPLYLVGTFGTDDLFYLDTTKWWTQTLPTSDDGKVYILLGTTYSTYQFSLIKDHPVYIYKDGKIQDYYTWKQNRIDDYLPLSGGTMTGVLKISGQMENACINLSNSNYGMKLGIGTAGVNRGLWDINLDKWVLYSDATDSYFNGNATSATKATQDGSGNTISSYYVTLSTNQTISGQKKFGTMPSANGICAVIDSSATAGGVSLYSDRNVTNYGLALRTTASMGKHGFVQGDYATYSFMSAAGATESSKRGWIFRDAKNDKATASISAGGNAVFNGSITVGGNETNTSGCRQEFNEDLQCIEFIFN